MDAHDFNDIERAFAEAEQVTGKPVAIIQKSVKGKGVSFMENQVSWHGSAPNKEQYEQAMAELNAALYQPQRIRRSTADGRNDKKSNALRVNGERGRAC